MIAAYPAAHAEIVRRWNTHEAMKEALRAIQARIVGEFDNPALVAFGPLTSPDLDIYAIAGAALAAAEGPGDTR